MNNTVLVVFVLLAVIIVLVTLRQQRHKCDSKVQFSAKLVQLFLDHAYWTRLYVVAALNNLPNLQVTLNQLLQNQTDIGNFLGAVSNDTAFGKTATALLREHILIAGQLVSNLVAKGTPDAALAEAWKTNATQIAQALSTKVNIPESVLNNMWQSHLSLTLQQVGSEYSKNYVTALQYFNQNKQHMYELALQLAHALS